MAGVTHVLRMASKDAFQHITSIVLISIGVFTVLSPSFFLFPIPYAIVYCLLLIGPLLVAANHYIQQVLLDKKTRFFSTILEGLTKYVFKSLMYSIIVSIFLFIVYASWWQWANSESYFFFLLACFQTYFIGMILISQIYTIPLMVKYNSSLKDSMILSVKLLIQNPLYTLGAFVQLVSLFVLLLLTGVGLFLLFPGFYSLFANTLTSNVMNQTSQVEKAV